MEYVEIEKNNRVVVVTIKRPEALNALNSAMLKQIVQPLQEIDSSPDIGCILITGDARAFAAGADIAELASYTYKEMNDKDVLAGWEAFADLRTPKVAAVAGYALGGGCELAMMCDIIYAAKNAKFGQPEIKLGLIPGMGGTQRLTRLVGRSKAMHMILTGDMMNAEDAERAGLVARVYSDDALMTESLVNAQTIANFGETAARAAIEAIDASDECGLAAGLLFERRTYHALWATDDAKEGMKAFLEKRPAVFSHQRKAN